MRLNKFLLKNRNEILAVTEKKTLELAGEHPTSQQLKAGLPTFLKEVTEIIEHAGDPGAPPPKNVAAIAKAADEGNEPAMAMAAGQPEEAELAKSANLHGAEYQRLGYTLSHVVHAYGAICQTITELATSQNVAIEARDFHALNRCLDVAIAGAVTTYQSAQDSKGARPKDKHVGLNAREMDNALARANVALESIRNGTVGPGGSTGQVLQENLTRLRELIKESLAGEDAA